MKHASITTPFVDRMKVLFHERLEAKGWTRYRLAKEVGARREQTSTDQVKASRYNAIVNKCLSTPDKLQVSTLVEIADCLDINLIGQVLENGEDSLS